MSLVSSKNLKRETNLFLLFAKMKISTSLILCGCWRNMVIYHQPADNQTFFHLETIFILCREIALNCKSLSRTNVNICSYNNSRIRQFLRLSILDEAPTRTRQETIIIVIIIAHFTDNIRHTVAYACIRFNW